MEGLYNAEVQDGSNRQDMARYPVDTDKLRQLHYAVRQWDHFLAQVFIIPTTEILTADDLDLMSLEDTEHYLDVKIQLSQCLRQAKDPALELKFDGICAKIRKATYHHISTILSNFADNRRSLVELARKNNQVIVDGSVSNMHWMSSPDLELSEEYKECLVLERKQLKLDLVRQRSVVRSLIGHLKREINKCFSSRSVE
jgi:hypothetical protein